MKRLQVEGWKVEGWKVERLGDVVEFQRGLTYSKKDEVESSSNIVLRANNVDLNTNALDFTELKYIKDKLIVPKEKKVAKGSLIICTASGSKSHLGKVALIDKNYDYAFGGFMGQITPKKIIDSKFLFYRMISEEYKRFIGKLSDGVNINNLRFDDLAQFEIPLPPLPEQKRIVSLLDETFAALAKVHDNAARNLVNAREVFESVQREIFSNGKGWKETTLGEVAENLD
ncbi:MAG: restriction endonuclease subunit S, partial [Anaerolineales bacterium]|nr:restriction endonuclease subunit S [Anaerolineales bacterium]